MSGTDLVRDLGVLEQERDGLLDAIRQLEAEHASGALSDDDYEVLRADHVARAASVLREIELVAATSSGGPAAEDAAGSDSAQQPSGSASRTGSQGTAAGWRRRLGRRGTRRVLGALGALCFVGIVTLFVLRVAGVRLPGEGVSGNISLPAGEQVREELSQAQQLSADGQASQALQIYQRILAGDPRQPEALAYRGWLLVVTGAGNRSTGVIAAGRSSIEEALAADPNYGDAHFFLGLTLLEDYAEPAEAVAQFDACLADGADRQLLHGAKTIVESAYAKVGATVPAALRGA
ncbi:MAG TPA: hypothetical protein VGS21_07350 [Acidimicrobiales bacterium]|nr:hypothetical protein [Acidimicrobiales bacterium]